MFSKHEYVFHESGGICQIVEIQQAPLENMPQDRTYYVLRPMHDPNSTIYIPTDSDRVFIRRILTHAEAEAFLAQIDSIEVLEAPNPKLLRARYVETMRTYSPRAWLSVIRTVELRAKQLAARSQRLSETERSFGENARRHLFGELSLALGIESTQAEALLRQPQEATV